jgi:glycosyltransferase involved in cell wall biosynthesis
MNDLRARSRWRQEEEPRPLRELALVARRAARARAGHLHAHFAAGAALDAIRVGALLGLPVSMTAHAHDIYAHPRNLAEKLARSSFSTSGCEYTVRDLKAIAGPEDATRVHEIVMGIDPGEFRRATPYRGGRSVLAVGRLVPKKGFLDLVEAARILGERGALPDRVVISGEGPQRGELEIAIERAGLKGVVVLTGAVSPAEVRELLEQADVLAAPCIVAADGDRDSMPLVVKEALAMEVPVVASNEVGLPEVVHDAWGRLHAPGDPESLADALQQVLDLPGDARARMGVAGREHVSLHCNVNTHTAHLLQLIADAAAGPARG